MWRSVNWKTDAYVAQSKSARNRKSQSRFRGNIILDCIGRNATHFRGFNAWFHAQEPGVSEAITRCQCLDMSMVTNAGFFVVIFHNKHYLFYGLIRKYNFDLSQEMQMLNWVGNIHSGVCTEVSNHKLKWFNHKLNISYFE